MKEATATAQPTANEGEAIPAEDAGAGAGASCAAELPTRAKIVTIAIATRRTLVWETAIATRYQVCITECERIRCWSSRDGERDRGTGCFIYRGRGGAWVGVGLRAEARLYGQLPEFTDWRLMERQLVYTTTFWSGR